VPWSVPDALLVYLLALLLMPVVVALVTQGLAQQLALAVALPLSLFVLALITLAWVRVRFEGQVALLLGPQRGRLRSPGGLVREAGAGAAHGLAAFLLINVSVTLLVALLARIFEFERPTSQEAIRGALADPDTVLVVVASAVLIAPLVEELFFRGMLYQAFRRRFWLWPAMGSSALLFALGHAQVGDLAATMLVFLVILPVGVYLAWLFERRGNLLAPVAAHAVFNGLGVGAILAGVG
jgi:uncharacterized protein